MKTVIINLNTIEKVKGFIGRATSIEEEMCLGDGNTTVDAKSILGILSLNLLKPLKFSVFTSNTNRFNEIICALSDFIESGSVPEGM